jgi:DnaJ-class molecular chaperone
MYPYYYGTGTAGPGWAARYHAVVERECRFCEGTGATASDIEAEVFKPCPACKGAGVHLVRAEGAE